MDWSRRTPTNEDALAVVHARLRAAGVPEGPHGYDLAALELAAAVLGWVSDAGPAVPGSPAPSVAAMWLRDDLAGTAYLGWGWSEAVALARALDRALRDSASPP
jgi:hypothetical protein